MLEQSAPTQKTYVPKAESPRSSSQVLADEPLVIIEPGKGWVASDLRGLWACRELLANLTWRDLRVRYKQTILGVLWVIMQPVLSTVIFTIFLGRLARIPSGTVPYMVFAYAGLLLWTFFSGAVSVTSNSLVANAHIITKVYFPMVIIPVAAVAARLVDFVIGFVLLAVLMIYYRVPIGLNIIALPLFVALITLLCLGFGMLTSAWNVKYRDIGLMLPLAVQLLMYVSPVVYPLSFVPEKWRWIFSLNPLSGIMEGFRTSLFGGAFNWWAIGASAIITIGLLAYALRAFGRMGKQFADIV